MEGGRESIQPHALRSNAGLRTFEIPCAAGHDVVYGLARGAGCEIYLAPSNEFCPGLCADIFAFNWKTGAFRRVVDVRAATGFDPASGAMPHCKIHLCLNSSSDGRAFAATHFTAPGIGQTDFDAISAYRDRFPGCHFIEYDPVADRSISHGLLLRGEGARISCLDEENGQYYFLSYPRGHLYRYDYRRRTLHDLGRTGQENSFGLESDGRGNVFTSDDLGRILVYSYCEDRLRETALFVPLAPGRRAGGNYIRRMTRGTDGALYGFSNKGVRLFRIDPVKMELEDFGPIFGSDGNPGYDYPDLPPAKAVVQVADGSLLVAFGGDGVFAGGVPVPNLVRFDLATRTATDLGRLVCPADGLPSWIPQCALDVPEADAVFVGLQQTTGQLRLWQFSPSQSAPCEIPAGAAYAAHVAVLKKTPFGASVEGRNALPFVRRGHVAMHELGWAGEDRVIPAGETAIASLAWYGGDALYGVTKGLRAHFFCYRPYNQNRFTENHEVHPWDLGRLGDAAVVDAAVFADVARKRLWIVTTDGATLALWEYAAGSELPRYRGVYHSLPHWPPVQWETESFRRLASLDASRISVASLSYDAGQGRLLGVDSAGGMVSLGSDGALVPLRAPDGFCQAALASVGADRWVGAREDGSWTRLRITAAAIEETVLCPAGTFKPVKLAASEAGIVAAADCDGGMFILDPADATRSLRLSLPRPWPVRAMAWHPANVVHGFQGEDDGIGEAFRVDPRAARVDTIGILQVSSQPRYWMCHRADAIATGARGEVYFGESDRLSHLFVFYPEVGPGGQG